MLACLAIRFIVLFIVCRVVPICSWVVKYLVMSVSRRVLCLYGIVRWLFLVFGFHWPCWLGILIFLSWKSIQVLLRWAISPALSPASPARAMISLCFMLVAVEKSFSYSSWFNWSCLLPMRVTFMRFVYINVTLLGLCCGCVCDFFVFHNDILLLF